MSIANTKKAFNLALVSFSTLAIVFTTSIASAQTYSDKDVERLMEQIRALTVQIEGIRGGETSTYAAQQGGSSNCSTWSKNLYIGSKGEDVRRLQQFLNTDGGTRVASSGIGSPGNETSYYGSLTANGVKRFQEKYAQQILAPLGLTNGTGYFYNSTRTQANKLCSSSSYNNTTNTSVGGGVATGSLGNFVSTGRVTVSGAAQPANGYAIKGATRLPFTTFNISATGGDVRVTGVTVERVGLIQNNLFDNIYIVEQNGGQKITSERSLNSDSEATLTGSFVVRSGVPATLVVVADISSLGNLSYGGTGALRVISVRTDTGTLTPNITGAQHTFSDSVDLGFIRIDNSSRNYNSIRQ